MTISAESFAVTYTKKADLDAYQYLAYTMSSVHEIIFRGLESIINHLETNKNLQADLNNWLGYVGAWVYFVLDHHRGEEEYLFPVLKKKGCSVEMELEQHVGIHQDVENISKAVEIYKRDKNAYDSEKLKDLCAECRSNLYEHLKHEVSMLNRDNLASKFTEEELRRAHEDWEGKVRKESNFFIAAPFVIYHTSAANYYWTEMPAIMYSVIVPLLSLRHRGWWELWQSMNAPKLISGGYVLFMDDTDGDEAKRVSAMSNEDVKTSKLKLKELYGDDILGPSDIVAPRWDHGLLSTIRIGL